MIVLHSVGCKQCIYNAVLFKLQPSLLLSKPRRAVEAAALLHRVQSCTAWGAVMNTELSGGSGGAAVTVVGRCPDCDCLFKWRSSELVPETQIAHVDLLSSAAILFTGSEIMQAFCLFQFMDVAVGMHTTFHRHQVKHLHKTICYVWRQKQQEHLESLRGEKVVLGGDGRHSTVGQSTLYCTYSAQDNASRKIVNAV